MSILNENRDALRWRKSGRSTTGNCVEVAAFSEGVALRNSRDPQGAVLVCTTAEFDTLLDEIKAGGFDYLLG